MLKLSICIIAYNEEQYLPRLLEDIKLSEYPHEYTEVVLIDGMSTDKTKQIMLDFKSQDNGFYNVQVLDNPKRIQAAGWNVAIQNFTGDVLSRIDAHTHIPSDFSRKVMADIESGEDIAGGKRPCLIESESKWSKMLLSAENALFGSSISFSRHSEKKTYVKSMFHASYRREVFAKVGGFHEDLGRTEDNELHFRIRQAGYKICQGSDIISYQYIRGTISSMMQQKFGNGKWIGLTLGVCYQCLQTYHFVPFFFVITLLCSLLLFVSAFITGHMWMAFPFCVVFGAYLLADLMMSLAAFFSAKQKNPTMLLLPCIFFLLHCAYGFGTIAGVLQLPFFLHRLKKQEKENGFSAAQRIENVRQKVIEHTVTPTKEDEI